MARRVVYPNAIEPLVQFVEDTPPERIVAATHDKLTSGTPVKELLLASVLAVARSSDLPPGHHGGPLHPMSGVHAIYHTAGRLPSDYAMLPVIQHVALSNKHIYSPAMGPFILPDAEPRSENNDLQATLEALDYSVSRGTTPASDHYFLYLMERLSPMQVLDHLLKIAIPKNAMDDHYFLFPIFTWRSLEIFGWEYMKYLGRIPVRYVSRLPAPGYLTEEDALIGLRSRVRLHVGEVAAEDLLGAIDGEIFDDVDVLAAAVVPLARIALGVLVGQDAAGRFKYSTRDNVFRRDEFDLMLLPAKLFLNGAEDFRVGFRQMRLEKARCLRICGRCGRHGRSLCSVVFLTFDLRMDRPGGPELPKLSTIV